MKKYSLLEMLEYSLDGVYMDKMIDDSGKDGAYEYHEEVEAIKTALSFCVDEILCGMDNSDSNSLRIKKLHTLAEINKIQNYFYFIDNHLFEFMNGRIE